MLHADKDHACENKANYTTLDGSVQQAANELTIKALCCDTPMTTVHDLRAARKDKSVKGLLLLVPGREAVPMCVNKSQKQKSYLSSSCCDTFPFGTGIDSVIKRKIGIHQSSTLKSVHQQHHQHNYVSPAQHRAYEPLAARGSMKPETLNVMCQS
jgi:hypothetical protein